ncbi:MAG: metallophosphoesterase [Oscillospiraceae bacterium]|nr:metallophosphoesterase [Oscillospiraceae bacterium]
MKIIVFSDSHRHLEGMRTVIDAENPDYVFHLGDHDTDAEELMRDYPLLPIVPIRGNCDGWSDSPESSVLQLDGLRFFLCHGHRYGVKYGFMQAVYAALEQNADVLLFGHTHEPYYEYMDAPGQRTLYILNPGSCGCGYPPSYGKIFLEPGMPPTIGYYEI